MGAPEGDVARGRCAWGSVAPGRCAWIAHPAAATPAAARSLCRAAHSGGIHCRSWLAARLLTARLLRCCCPPPALPARLPAALMRLTSRPPCRLVLDLDETLVHSTLDGYCRPGGQAPPTCCTIRRRCSCCPRASTRRPRCALPPTHAQPSLPPAAHASMHGPRCALPSTTAHGGNAARSPADPPRLPAPSSLTLHPCSRLTAPSCRLYVPGGGGHHAAHGQRAAAPPPAHLSGARRPAVRGAP